MIRVIIEKSIQHLLLSMGSLLLALCIALPLGFLLTQSKREKITLLIIRAISLIQTIPGLAMLALIMVFLLSIQMMLPIPTTGFLPAVLSLSLYAISPILTNTYTGIRQTNPSLVDVATGVGMTQKQTLFYVQIPHAIPMILAGIRIAGVWTIGMCTLASLIGAGGLGDLILQGLRSLNPKYVLAGTLPAILLAIFFEIGMSSLEKWLRVET